MPDEDVKAEVVKGAVQLADKAYGDALTGPMKEVGKTLTLAGRAINLALSPIAGMVWTGERVLDFVHTKVEERLKDVPPERIQTPNPTVAGPALQALVFAGHEPTLAEMFANLLGTAMDRATAHAAHPAFVEVLKQLNPDEARIVKALYPVQPIPVISVYQTKDRGVQGKENTINVFSHFSLIGEQLGCASPGLTNTYLENIDRLSLASLEIGFTGRRYIAPGIYEPLERHPRVQEVIALIKARGAEPEVWPGGLFPSAFGKLFWDACVGPHPFAAIDPSRR